MYLVAQLCLTLWTPWTVACQVPLSMGISRQEYWSGFPFPLQGIFPIQGLNPGLLPALQVDFFFFFLLSESPRKPKSAGMDSLSLLQVIFLTQELIQVSYIAGRFFTSWAIWEGPRNLRHGLIILLLNHCKESMLPKVIN